MKNYKTIAAEHLTKTFLCLALNLLIGLYVILPLLKTYDLANTFVLILCIFTMAAINLFIVNKLYSVFINPNNER